MAPRSRQSPVPVGRLLTALFGGDLDEVRRVGGGWAPGGPIYTIYTTQTVYCVRYRPTWVSRCTDIHKAISYTIIQEAILKCLCPNEEVCMNEFEI